MVHLSQKFSVLLFLMLLSSGYVFGTTAKVASNQDAFLKIDSNRDGICILASSQSDTGFEPIHEYRLTEELTRRSLRTMSYGKHIALSASGLALGLPFFGYTVVSALAVKGPVSIIRLVGFYSSYVGSFVVPKITVQGIGGKLTGERGLLPWYIAAAGLLPGGDLYAENRVRHARVKALLRGEPLKVSQRKLKYFEKNLQKESVQIGAMGAAKTCG